MQIADTLSGQLAVVKRDILNKQRLTNNEISKIKCSTKNGLVADQPNLFTNSSDSAPHEPTNELLTAKPITSKTEEITHLSDNYDTLLNEILNKYLIIKKVTNA